MSVQLKDREQRSDIMIWHLFNLISIYLMSCLKSFPLLPVWMVQAAAGVALVLWCDVKLAQRVFLRSPEQPRRQRGMSANRKVSDVEGSLTLCVYRSKAPGVGVHFYIINPRGRFNFPFMTSATNSSCNRGLLLIVSKKRIRLPHQWSSFHFFKGSLKIKSFLYSSAFR